MTSNDKEARVKIAITFDNVSSLWELLKLLDGYDELHGTRSQDICIASNQFGFRAPSPDRNCNRRQVQRNSGTPCPTTTAPVRSHQLPDEKQEGAQGQRR